MPLRHLILPCALVLLCAVATTGCDDDDDGAANNGATNNGATNNGATSNGATSNGATNNDPDPTGLDNTTLNALLSALGDGALTEARLEAGTVAVEAACDVLVEQAAPEASAVASEDHAVTLPVDCGADADWLDTVQTAIDDHDGASWLVIGLSGDCAVPANHNDGAALWIEGARRVELRGEGARIDGAAWSAGHTDESVLITIVDSEDLIVRGLELSNVTTATEGADAAAVYAEGVTRLVLEDLAITDITVDYDAIGDPTEGNAYAIKVVGTDPGPSREVLIRYLYVGGTRTGQSENITLAGNVSAFAVAGNVIYDVDNIGIDLIGGEEFGASQARSGVVCGNGLGAQQQDNAAYDGGESFGAGIYLDGGGTDCLVALNAVEGFARGFEVGAEGANPTVVRAHLFGNISFAARAAGLLMGSLAERDNPSVPTDRGTVVERMVIVANQSTAVETCLGGPLTDDEGAAHCEGGSVEHDVEVCFGEAMPASAEACLWYSP